MLLFTDMFRSLLQPSAYHHTRIQMFVFLCDNMSVCVCIYIYPKLCVFPYAYFNFLGRVNRPSAKPLCLEDQFVSFSLASLLRPVRLGRPYQEHKVPAGVARKITDARKLPHHDKVETCGRRPRRRWRRVYAETDQTTKSTKSIEEDDIYTHTHTHTHKATAQN
jgi:hypothetical protein